MTSVIFCDGACKGNGYKGAIGGWAYAYWPGPRAVGEPQFSSASRLAVGPEGEAPTNQRAELKALLESLRFSKTLEGPVIIHTDSQYAMNCTEKWGPSWKKAGWKRASGEPLQNLDLIKELVDIFATLRTRVSLKHVRGHQTNSSHEAWGNNWVDKAAVAGSLGPVHVPVHIPIHIPIQGPAKGPVQGHTQGTHIPTQGVQGPTQGTRGLAQTDLRSWFS